MRKTMLMLLALMCVGVMAQDYKLAFPETQVSHKPDKGITALKFITAKHGEMTFRREGGTNYIYRPMLSSMLCVAPGEEVTAQIMFDPKWLGGDGLWMNGYVYLDKDNDGQFDVDLAAITIDTPAPNGDLLAYSYIETVENRSGFNMAGEALSGDARDNINIPAFIIPKDLAPGMYRMRVKMDWGDADPAGRMTATNNIVQNGGQIIDLMVSVRKTNGVLNQQGEHGVLTLADGKAIDNSSLPFGKQLVVRQQPDEGYAPGAVTVRYGWNLDGEAVGEHGNLMWSEVEIPATRTGSTGLLTLPANYAAGDMMLTSHFVDASTLPAKGDYPCNFDKDALTCANTGRAISAITLASAEGYGTVGGWNTSEPLYVYTDASDQMVRFMAGETIKPSVSAKSTYWMHAYFYIDYDNNGYFDTGEDVELDEMVTRTTNGENYASIPSFTLPDWLPAGDYRVRFKTDWSCSDPGGRYGEGYSDDFIDQNCGQIIDFTLRIEPEMKSYKLVEKTELCNLYMADGVSSLPTVVRGDLTFKLVPMQDYVLKGTLQVKVGSVTNRISAKNIPDDGIITIPNINGNVTITATCQQGPEASWQCVFNDEFNETRTGWNDEVWTTTPKSGATWARFNSQSMDDGVVVERDGYVSFKTKTVGDGQMLTGNIRARADGPGTFTYGRVEARCLVHPHKGNFPAFWMMPAHQKPNYSGTGTWGGWPHSGEIDIMEQINSDNTAHHTIHSHWANGAGEGGMGRTYQKTASEYVDMSRWHIYALEWDEEQLRWYVDGRQVHRYDRIAANDNDSDRQWPFDQPFYIILNQSVGNGGWAASPDFNHEYCMDVDYVRAYQRCIPSAVSEQQAQRSIDVRTGDGCIILGTALATPVRIVTLGGITVFNATVNGTKSVPVRPGIYIVAGKKVVVK